MPHLVILYTPNLDAPGRGAIATLCRTLADVMLEARDDSGNAVFPPGGTRVLAYPAAHFALADGGAAGRAAGGTGEYAFVYLQLRMARGRSAAVHARLGEALKAAAAAHFETLLATTHVGITLQIDEGHEVYDAKLSSLHPLFRKP